MKEWRWVEATSQFGTAHCQIRSIPHVSFLMLEIPVPHPKVYRLPITAHQITPYVPCLKQFQNVSCDWHRAIWPLAEALIVPCWHGPLEDCWPVLLVPRMGPPREHEGRCSRLLLWKYAPSCLQCPPPAQLCAVEGAHRVWILGSQEHWVILETGTLTCFQVPSGFHMQNSHFCFPNGYLENTHVFHISPSSLTLISLKISPRYLTMTQSD